MDLGQLGSNSTFRSIRSSGITIALGIGPFHPGLVTYFLEGHSIMLLMAVPALQYLRAVFRVTE